MEGSGRRDGASKSRLSKINFSVPSPAHRLATACALGACRFDSVTTGLARGLPTWQSMPMPDYSLFGDEHVRRNEATGGTIVHGLKTTSSPGLHTIGRESADS